MKLKKIFLVIPFILVVLICNSSYATEFGYDDVPIVGTSTDKIISIVQMFLILLSISVFICSVVIGIFKKRKLKIGSKEKTKKQERKINIKMTIGIMISIMIFFFASSLSVVKSLDKPIIYVYPMEETQVSVILGESEKLIHTYPKYKNEWSVLVKTNGDLVDLKTGRNLYALYWEGLNTVKPNLKEGFVIQGKDTISFLEEKLGILGLTEREANEFIIYWLPKLENNKYNFIRFQTIEEINKNMPLEINPKPDTIIRVMMEFKALNKRINIKEQGLKTPKREGFVVVEWGGTEVK